ncbi:Cy92 [Cynomolgus cytomegalovirus]|uniref:Protein UL56 n=1 Tax=Cynomolgus macaque cytomegalovirus strain Mauritius TaxID=1690255 RepID=A0A0K1GZN9_9BETA|nr:Cy92 [Cynomolgus cytomegalovirus]AKT72641.1 protein UL56 [Cynomolgus macaque cytomegalovirus strain Mauritius]AXG21789.1 protein UL56 [synthetic construct]APT39459.1 Cy92 [Cynomolgus cytomegalovirus]APT39632.1 Cy92 [Cynomolgus cytomegalovirus]APT39805.1 Cy92 [Cynomolgus cytomegalovirus]
MTTMSNEELSAIAPVGPAAYLYFTKTNPETNEVLATLSLCDRSTPVVIAPLLMGLTVDQDFCTSVRTPVVCYDGGVLTKVTSFCPFVMYFHNTQEIIHFSEPHGEVQRLCDETRQKYSLETYVPEEGRAPTDLAALCTAAGCDPQEVVVHVVVGNGLKEFLYAGQLIPCFEEAVPTRLNDCDAVRVPLYPPTLFGSLQADADSDEVSLDKRNSFVESRGLYVPAVSEALFYYVYTSWCQALRFSETKVLIEAALKQFVHDSQQSVKLAPHKKYFGYTSQKLSSLEKDQLMLSDAVICELGFSFASVFLDSAYGASDSMVYSEWPVVMNAADHRELIKALTELKLHLSTHISALLFSCNSILYQNRLVYLTSNKNASGTGASQEALLKSIHFANGLTGLCEDTYNDARKLIKSSGTVVKDERYAPHHLALICGTCPQLFSALVWYLNRVSVYNTGLTGSSTLSNHLIGCSSSLCGACGGTCCHTCYNTAFVRVQTRLPQIPRLPKKEPCVVVMQSRFLNDVDTLGTFGRRYSAESKETNLDTKADEGSAPTSNRSASSSVDRTHRLNRILDYCKKMRLIDSVTGEDTMTINGRADFINLVSSLNKFVDDEAMSFVSEVRMKSSRDEVSGATQAFNLDLSPYAVAFNPILSYEYYRVILAIIQNVALITATSYIVDNPLTTSLVSRWVTQHFQSIHGAFSTTSSRKGFLFIRNVKSSKNVDHDRLPDFKLYARGTYSVIPMEIKLSRLSVPALLMFRVKNRPISKASKGTTAHVFFRREHVPKKNPVKGCLGFLLYKYHDKLFPDCGFSCLQFWQKVCANALPKNVSIGDMGEFNNFVKFVISVTADYNEHDLIDVAPDCMLNYLEHRFHNKFLCFYGFKDYIGTLHGLTTRLTYQNHAQFPYLLGETPNFASPADFALRLKDLKAAGVIAPLAATVTRESLMRTIFEQRSLITVSFSVEKYAGVNSNKDIYQFGQIGYFSGNGVERSLNTNSMGGQDYKFMRQRCILATKLSDVLIKRSRRENVLFDEDIIKNRVMAALDSDNLDVDPELMAMYEILSTREEIPERDDVLFFVDGCQVVADSLMEKFSRLREMGVADFSLPNLQQVLDSRLEPGGGGEVHDLSALFTAPAVGEAAANSVGVNAGGGEHAFDDDCGLLPAKRGRL